MRAGILLTATNATTVYMRVTRQRAGPWSRWNFALFSPRKESPARSQPSVKNETRCAEDDPTTKRLLVPLLITYSLRYHSSVRTAYRNLVVSKEAR